MKHFGQCAIWYLADTLNLMFTGLTINKILVGKCAGTFADSTCVLRELNSWIHDIFFCLFCYFDGARGIHM
jgi:hypothetical protein